MEKHNGEKMKTDTGTAAETGVFESSALKSGEPTEKNAHWLKEELKRANARFCASVEQYETQAEQLRASNEKLQSVTEELLTVNQELKIKIEELSISNNDFQNILNSTDFGTIFLDRSLRVKMFTPPVREIFNLTDADINRPLADITTKIDLQELHRDVERVLDTPQTVEREFETDEGKWYLMRVFPYRTTEDRIGGAVVTFTDISNRIRSEQALHRLVQNREQQMRIFDTTLSSIADFTYTFDRAGRFIYANRPLLDLLGVTLGEITGKTFNELPYPKDLANKLQAQIERVFETNKSVIDETPFINPAGDEGFYEYIFAPVIGEDGTVEVVAGSTRVTTERRKSEEKLRESEERLQTLVKNLPGGAAFILDRDLRYLLAEGEALAGVGVTSEDFIGKTLYDVLAPELAVEYEAMYRKALAGESFTHEHDEYGKTFITRGTPLRLASSEVYAALAVSYDISDRKKAEEKLRESEERFRAMFEQANVGIVQLSADGRVLAPNPGFCKIIGYAEAEARRLTVRDITHPDDYDREAELTRQLVAGEIYGFSIEKRFIRQDGKIIWGNMTAALVRQTKGDDPIYMLSIVEDISERKAAEEAVRGAKERLQLLIESASDYAIFTVTPDNIVDSWNAGAEKVFGYTEAEIIGKSGAILFTSKDRAAGVPEQEINAAAANEGAEDERWHIRKDGSRFFASGVMRPLKDGKLEGFVKISRDMTDKIKAEKTLLDKEILQRMVGAQEDERKRIARDLHDHLGQQLTALRLKLENARKLCGDDGELSGKIDETQIIAKHIDDDVDFLAWELRPAALDDLGLVAAVENYAKEWSRHSGVTSEFYTSGLNKSRLAPEVETNLYRIAQEALNNVFKHAAAKSVTVMLEKRGSLIILIVEDNGKGFNVAEKQDESKGLGLVGMSERATLIGGKIQVESAPEKGTTIFVRIPIQNELIFSP